MEAISAARDLDRTQISDGHEEQTEDGLEPILVLVRLDEGLGAINNFVRESVYPVGMVNVFAMLTDKRSREDLWRNTRTSMERELDELAW